MPILHPIHLEAVLGLDRRPNGMSALIVRGVAWSPFCGLRLNDKVWLYWNEDLNQPVRFQRERNYKGYYMTGPEFFYLFEYIKCESSKDPSFSSTIKIKISQSYLVSESLEWQISQNSRKFGIYSIGTSINVLCRTRISNSLRILQLSV